MTQVRVGFHAVPNGEVAEKILKSGFADLAVLDPGYFGQGTYFSLDLPYALSHYSKPDGEGCQHVLVCAILWGNAYPVIEIPHPDKAESLYAKPCAPSHDAHIVCVDGTEDLPNPIHFSKWKRCPKLYSEVVIFDKSQILPLGWLVFPERILALEGYRVQDGIEQVRVKWSRYRDHQWRSVIEVYHIDPDALLAYLARENITPLDSGIAIELSAAKMLTGMCALRCVGLLCRSSPHVFCEWPESKSNNGVSGANGSLSEPFLQDANRAWDSRIKMRVLGYIHVDEERVNS